MGGTDQMELSIVTVPADDDRPMVTIANRLRDHLTEVGINASVDLLELSEFRLQVLFNGDFDIALVRHPDARDPDYLYGLLHSRFAPGRGWQNLFGVTSHVIDELLESQRQETGDARREEINLLLHEIAAEQPLTPLCVPNEQTIVRQDTFTEPVSHPIASTGAILSLELSDSEDGLTVGIRDTSPTINLNPLSIEYRDRGVITGLLYDSLLRFDGSDVVPWLADAVTWHGQTAQVLLREATWHDDRPVTADDVAFTYEFLSDTANGSGDQRTPAPRYRGRSSLVESVTVVDDRTVDITCSTTSSVAERGMTVPILPEHVWSDRTEQASVGPLSGDVTVTEALVTDNIPPVGSGPYQYHDRSTREFLELTAVDDHFSQSVPELSGYRPPSAVVRFEAFPNEGAAFDGVEDGTFDFILPTLHDVPGDLPDGIAEIEAPGSNLVHIAYNLERTPLGNRNFRRIVSRLMDKSWVADVVLDGRATPVSTPLADSTWIPDSLQFDDSDPETPFFGSDGTLDADAAREALAEAGFAYNDEGDLLVQR